jgi:hypothetical protein
MTPLADALVVADDAGGYPLDVLEARLELLEAYPAIRRQLVDEIARRKVRRHDPAAVR